jgi:hypothetical protein
MRVADVRSRTCRRTCAASYYTGCHTYQAQAPLDAMTIGLDLVGPPNWHHIPGGLPLCPIGGAITTHEKAPDKGRGFFVCGPLRSVFGDDWHAPIEAVVHTGSHYVDVLTGACERRRQSRRYDCNGPGIQADMIVFEFCRPIGRKTPFSADTDNPSGMT